MTETEIRIPRAVADDLRDRRVALREKDEAAREVDELSERLERAKRLRDEAEARAEEAQKRARFDLRLMHEMERRSDTGWVGLVPDQAPDYLFDFETKIERVNGRGRVWVAPYSGYCVYSSVESDLLWQRERQERNYYHDRDLRPFTGWREKRHRYVRNPENLPSAVEEAMREVEGFLDSLPSPLDNAGLEPVDLAPIDPGSLFRVGVIADITHHFGGDSARLAPGLIDENGEDVTWLLREFGYRHGAELPQEVEGVRVYDFLHQGTDEHRRLTESDEEFRERVRQRAAEMTEAVQASRAARDRLWRLMAEHSDVFR